MENVTMKEVNHKCDFCNEVAIYDTQTKLGPWAYVCTTHYEKYATKTPGSYSLLKPMSQTTKVCTICGEPKPVADYYTYVDARGVSRYRTECKECNLQGRKEAENRKWKMRKDAPK